MRNEAKVTVNVDAKVFVFSNVLKLLARKVEGRGAAGGTPEKGHDGRL